MVPPGQLIPRRGIVGLCAAHRARGPCDLPAPGDLSGGDLTRHADRGLVKFICGDNLPYREAIARKLDLMRAELADPDPSPLERLMVEHVVTC
jgi:hypothetical protein